MRYVKRIGNWDEVKAGRGTVEIPSDVVFSALGSASIAGGATVTGVQTFGGTMRRTGSNGEAWNLKAKSAIITCTTGGTTADTGDGSNAGSAAFIPAGSMVIGAVAYVTTAITGASGNLSIGPVGAATAWLNAKASKLAAESTANSYTEGAATGPVLFATDTEVRITSGTGNFTAGAVRVTFWFWTLDVPTS
jgi:hypothetical protein